MLALQSKVSLPHLILIMAMILIMTVMIITKALGFQSKVSLLVMILTATDGRKDLIYNEV